MAILSGNGGDILDYAGVDRVGLPIPPLLMIPSTSGTGADVSQFCIVTDTDRLVKITIMGRALVPDISVTDPRLLNTMPELLNAATGLDALTHGIEAFVSRAHNPLADSHALNAVALVCGHLRSTMVEPDDMGAAREWEVLRLLARGLSNKDIGGKLFISETTAKFHVGNILRELGVSRRAEAVYEASKMGVI